MNGKRDYSDEMINAYVDGELDESERVELLADAARSRELSQRICQTQQIKELVGSAYPLKHNTDNPPLQREAAGGWRHYTAAATIAALSLTLLWQTGSQSPLPGRATGISLETPVVEHNQTGEAIHRVVFHISHDDPEQGREMFDQVELVLKEYAQKGQAVKVDVVANNSGLRLFQQGRSAFVQRIVQMDARYPNLNFAACGNTIARIKANTGESVEVLPQAMVIRSGVSFLARRQQQGWVYIKV